MNAALAPPKTSFNTISHTALSAGYFLCGIGMTLPISNQSSPPLVGFIILIIVALLSIATNQRNFILKEINTSFRSNILFFALIGTMVAAGIPGAGLSILFSPEYGARNLATLVRLTLYILLVVFSAAITRRYKFNIATHLLMGTAFASAWNLIDFFSGNATTSSLAGQNPLGYCLSVTLPFAAINIFSDKGKRKFLWALIFISLIASIILTWSKAAWINAIVILLTITLSQSRNRKSIYITLAFIGALLSLYLTFYQEIYWIFETELSASEGSSSNEMRVTQIVNGVRIFSQYPFGIGNATYPAAAESLGLRFPQGTPPDPHNSYIQVLVGFGALGFISYILALAYIPYSIIRNTKHDNTNLRFVSLLVMFSLYFQGLFIGELLTQPLSWILFGHILGSLPATTARSR